MLLQPVDAQVCALPMKPTHVSSLYHAMSVEDCLNAIQATRQGLSDQEVQTRSQTKAKFLGDTNKARFKGCQRLFLNSLTQYVSLLFLAASGLSFYMGNPTEGVLIIGALLANSGLQGLVQWKFLKTQDTMQHTDEIRCTVRRDGTVQTLKAADLVLGDILIISAGQVMPADARLLNGQQIQVDESLVTGESVLVPKNASAVLHPQEDITAQCNMLFAGTLVKTGKGEAVVTSLGKDTVMGKIANLAQTTAKRQSPFTKKLNRLSYGIFLFVLALTAIVICVGYYQGLPLPKLLQIGLMMGIAAFPETIPSMVSLIFSLGMSRLQEKKVLVKQFQALETMGDVQVICTDKTGTLTENYLIFDQLFLPGLGTIPYDPQWQQGGDFPCQSVAEFLRVGRLNNGTMVEGLRSPLMGDPIDVALYRAAPAFLESGYHQRVSIPFDPVQLRSATLCEAPDGMIVSMIKGAPESVMEICNAFMAPDGSIQPLSLTQRSEFLMFNRKLAYEHNLRVIGFAQKRMTEDDTSGPYQNAIFLGWVCLLDPPKPGVVETVETLHQFGGSIIMITGDQKATAEITARELGIIRRNSDEVWLRSDLEAWEEPNIPESVRVFARTKPEEKLAIVESIQRSGYIVAMVGDGVNDSPALQKSDVAIAMGLQGAAAAKENADIILLNDRLEGIVYTILESRILRRKVQSCIRYLLSCNLGLILFIAAATLSGFVDSVHIIQMLWLNLVIVAIPTVVLAIEPVSERDVMPPSAEPSARPNAFQPAKAQWQTISANPLDSAHLFLAGYWAVFMMLAALGAYLLCLFVLKQPAPVAGTAAFCALALAQTFNLFNVQALNAGQNRRAFMTELASTPMTWVVIAVALGLQALITYTPGVQVLMGTVALPLLPGLAAVGLGIGAMLFALKTMKI